MTLIELLLAITLFSTLMASAGSLLSSGLRAQLGWDNTLRSTHQMERAFSQLEHDVESARVFFGAPFNGAEQQLELARVDLIQIDGQSAAEWVRLLYEVSDEEDGRWLTREVFVWKTQGADSEPLERARLLRLSSGQFAFGMLDAEGQFIWAPSWDGKKYGVPRFVKFDGAIAGLNGPSAMTLSRVIRNPAGNLPTLESP
jgi:type II secretory pathway pseudopilin PulG